MKRPAQAGSSTKKRESLKFAEKWRIVEHVVAAVESANGHAGGWTVVHNAMVEQRQSKKRRQVDVFAQCPSGARTFRVAIDVKHEKAPLDIEKVEQLCAKAKKLDVDRYVIVSTSGFAAEAFAEAARCGVEAVRLEELKSPAFFLLRSVTIPRANVTLIAFAYYDDDTPRPSTSAMRRAWVETPDRSTQLNELALTHLRVALSEPGAIPEGQGLTLRVMDEGKAWQVVHCDGSTWPPPPELFIQFDLVHEHAPGYHFRTEQGQEIFTATILDGSDLTQATFVATADAEGGTNVSVAWAPARPKQTAV